MQSSDIQPTTESGGPALDPPLELMLRHELEIALRLCMVRRPARLSAAEIASIRSALTEVCAGARANGRRAEQLVLMTHQIFAALPLASAIAARPDGTELLSRIVSLVIDAYYGAPARVD